MPARRLVTDRQLEILVDFAEAHTDIALGRFPNGPQSNAQIRETWEMMANRLNAVAEGTTKTGTQWRRYWIELKAKIKTKGADSRRTSNATGGGPSKLHPLTLLEERVLALIGTVAVDGLPGVRLPIDIPSLPNTSRTTMGTQNPSMSSEPAMHEEWLEVFNPSPAPLQERSSFLTTSEEPPALQNSPIEPSHHGQRRQSTPQPVRERQHRTAPQIRRRTPQHERIPRWAYEIESRRLDVEERQMAALERIASAIEKILEGQENDRRHRDGGNH